MDLGLLSGIANGLSDGITNYNTVQANRQKLQGDRESRDLALAQAGYQRDDNGKVVPNQTKAAQLAKQQELSDASTPGSAQARERGKGLLRLSNPNIDQETLNQLIPDTMAGVDVEDYLKPAITGGYGAQGNQIKANGLIEAAKARTAATLPLQQQRLGLQQDKLASNAADKIYNDKRVLNLTQSLDQLNNGRQLLDDPNMTYQQLNDYQLEVQKALAGSGNTALGNLERTEYKSIFGDLAKLKQYATGEPQAAVPQGIRETLKQTADSIAQKMETHRSERAQSLKRNYANTPAANEEQQKAIDKYQPKKGLIDNQPNPNPSPNAGMMDMVRIKTNDGRTGTMPRASLKQMAPGSYTEIQ